MFKKKKIKDIVQNATKQAMIHGSVISVEVVQKLMNIFIGGSLIPQCPGFVLSINSILHVFLIKSTISLKKSI